MPAPQDNQTAFTQVQDDATSKNIKERRRRKMKSPERFSQIADTRVRRGTMGRGRARG